jgi:hypothetical protein
LAEGSISTSNSILNSTNVERSDVIDYPINLSIENILDLSSLNNLQPVNLHSDSDVSIVQRKSAKLAQMSFVESNSVSSVYVQSVEPPPLSTFTNKTKKIIRLKMTFNWTKQFKFPVDLPPFEYSSIP